MESLKLPAKLESLKAIREFVGQASRTAGLSQARSYGLALAVDEVATNVIVHGHEEAGLTGDIVLHAQAADGTVEITIEDGGVPFDPLSHIEPDDLDTPLDEREVGGLGIFLAQKNVDELRYAYENGRNHNIFVIRPKPTAS